MLRYALSVFLVLLITNGTADAFEYYIQQGDSIKKKIHAAKDTSIIRDTLLARRDSIKSLEEVNIKPLNDGANVFIINNASIKLTDYRYSGDIIQLFPFSFLQDLGSLGQPAEMQLYGTGYSGVSYMRDGIPLNNRWQNSFDLYHIQSESVDSIELISLTSGFMHGSMNNPVAVNFISKDKINRRPYSRIRFYQASDEEGLADVIYSGLVLPRTNITFEVSSQSINSRGGSDNKDYNMGLGNWQASGLVRYLLAEKINLRATYNYLRSEVKLNGGLRPEFGLYNASTAEAVYKNRFQRTTRHDYSAGILAEFIQNSYSEFTVYYQSNRNDFKQDKKNLSEIIPTVVDTSKTRTYGILARQSVSTSLIDFDVAARFEKIDFDAQVLRENYSTAEYSLSASAVLRFNEYVIPKIYVKHLNYDGVSYPGFGGEVKINAGTGFHVFAGASSFKQPFSIIERELLPSFDVSMKKNIGTIEAGFDYSNSYLSSRCSYFYYSDDKFSVPLLSAPEDSLIISEVSSINTRSITRQGINLLQDIKIWKLLISGNASYYFNSADNDLSSLPSFNFKGGIYYLDTLFESSLYLKAGLNYYYIGSKSYYIIDFERSLTAAFYTDFTRIGGNVPASHRLDIFAAGTIQKNATVYFVYENILDNNYYIAPYYPMNAGGMRIGIAWEFMD